MLTQKDKKISEKTEKEILSRLEKRASEYKGVKFFEFGRWSSVMGRAAYFLGMNPWRVLIPAVVVLAVVLALVFKERLVYLVSVFQGGF